MQEIPKTFCPAKWDELFINFSYNMVYACCKATPVHFDKDYESVIRIQQDNLLNNIKDPSCEYCWKTEGESNSSHRLMYLDLFDSSRFPEYKNGTAKLKQLQINLGNSCNLQCIYCNPKFSSKWENDVKFKKYPIVSDRFNYEILKKNKDLTDQNLNFLSKFEDLEIINISGGEPLYNNRFFELLDYAKADVLSFVTNLNVDRSVIDKLLTYKNKFKKIKIGCSIDAVDSAATFLRHGIDIDLFYDNLNYLLSKKDTGLEISIQTLMTNISVVDIENTIPKFLDMVNKYKITWRLYYCKTPRILSFESLNEYVRDELKTQFNKLTDNEYITGAEVVIGALQNVRFDKGIFKEFEYFLKEWQERKQVSIPEHIKERLYAQTK